MLGTGGVFFDSMLIYVIRNHEAYKGRGAQDGHLDFDTKLLSSAMELHISK